VRQKSTGRCILIRHRFSTPIPHGRTDKITRPIPFLATQNSLINEIADLAEKSAANVQEVARELGLDNRIVQIPARGAWIRRVLLSEGPKAG